MKTQKVSALITALLLVITTLIGNHSAEAQSTKLPCRIEISIAHISKNLWIKTGKRAVKVDAFSRCHSPQSKVTFSYYGIAYSKAFIEGKWQYARHVLLRIINPIDCGT
ncbi:MAG: hypothetical protein Q8K48_08130 [Candidatus Planktophila sp.]|nr:hypothetical protein [Candidatus Planktophila sp.]